MSAGDDGGAAIAVVGAAIVDGGRCLVARRGAAMTEPLRWEFPGGKVEPGEAPRAALARELREELGLDVEVGALLGRGEVTRDGRRLVLDVYVARRVGGEVHLAEHADARWIDAAGIDALDWADADVPVLPALRRLLAGGDPRATGGPVGAASAREGPDG